MYIPEFDPVRKYRLSTVLREYPHLFVLEGGLRFVGTLEGENCDLTDPVANERCIYEFEEECTGTYVFEAVPGVPGCVGGRNAQELVYAVYLETEYTPPASFIALQEGTSEASSSLDDGQIVRFEISLARAEPGVDGATHSGSFAVPEGARAFQIMVPGADILVLRDPNGKEYESLFDNTADPTPVKYHWSRSIAITQATSDIDYSYADVVVPGLWTFRSRTFDTDVPPAVLVIKTRNDPDDKVRLKIVNATTRENDAFTPRVARMVELAARFGVNLEISNIHRIEHMDDPHYIEYSSERHWNFCDRFCSADEAVVLITEPGGWSSPGQGFALKVPFNTHFLVGAEVATSENDHFLAAAVHELLHYVAGLDHLYETHIDGTIDADALASTGVHNEVVGGTTRITGGVNHERLLRTGQLVWNDNLMVGWRMADDVPDDDAYGYTLPDGRRLALVAFLEHHQLEWVKNSPLYW